MYLTTKIVKQAWSTHCGPYVRDSAEYLMTELHARTSKMSGNSLYAAPNEASKSLLAKARCMLCWP